MKYCIKISPKEYLKDETGSDVEDRQWWMDNGPRFVGGSTTPEESRWVREDAAVVFYTIEQANEWLEYILSVDKTRKYEIVPA